jgi:hypothetical protein
MDGDQHDATSSREPLYRQRWSPRRRAASVRNTAQAPYFDAGRRLVPYALVEYTSVQRGLPDARHERHFEDAAGRLGYRIVAAYESRPGWRGLLDRTFVRRAIERAARRTLANLDRCFSST